MCCRVSDDGPAYFRPGRRTGKIGRRHVGCGCFFCDGRLPPEVRVLHKKHVCHRQEELEKTTKRTVIHRGLRARSKTYGGGRMERCRTHVFVCWTTSAEPFVRKGFFVEGGRLFLSGQGGPTLIFSGRILRVFFDVVETFDGRSGAVQTSVSDGIIKAYHTYP